MINRSPDDDPNLFQRVLKSEQKKIAKQTTDILSDGYYVFEDADKKLVTVSIEEEQRAAVLGTHQFSAIEMEMLLHKHGYSKVPPTPPQSSDSTAETGGPNSLLRSMLPRSSPPPTKPPSSAVVHFCCTAKIEKVTVVVLLYKRKNGNEFKTLQEFGGSYGASRYGVDTMIEVTGETTLAACRRLLDDLSVAQRSGRVGCLNFGSATNACGGFLNGTGAQEESLARASCLYSCLMSEPTFYQMNRKTFPKSGLYGDRAIYSPGVCVFRSGSLCEMLPRPYLVDIITMPPCNVHNAKKDPRHIAQVFAIMRKRAAYILAIAIEKKIDCLVLGAWGCGAFDNDPQQIAEHFAFWLIGPQAVFANRFRRIIFAIHKTAERVSKTDRAVRNRKVFETALLLRNDVV